MYVSTPYWWLHNYNKINALFKTPSYKNEHVHVYRRPQFIARLPNACADESGC